MAAWDAILYKGRRCLVAMVVLTLLLPRQHSASGEETISACSSNPNKTLDIQCGPGYMVHIVRSFYGYSASGKCRLVKEELKDDCVEPDPAQYTCVGQPSCQINLPPGEHGINIKNCHDRPSNYFQVDYKCVKESTVYDICTERQLTGESGYIRTPGYPKKYVQQGQCNVTIIAHPSQQIRLHIIDLHLKERNHKQCYDHIYFRDTQRSITLCGQRINKSYDMKSNVYIEVFSSSGGMSKGFWLYYEAYPPLPNTIERPTMAPNTNNDNDDTENSNKIKTRQDVSSSSYNYNHNNKHNNDYNNHNNDYIKNNNNNNNNESKNKAASKQDETYETEVSKEDNHEMITETTPIYNKGNTVPLIRNDTGSTGNSLPFAAIAGGVIGTLSLILIILLMLLLVKWLRERQYYKAEKILEIKNPAFRSSGDFYEQHPPNNSNYYNPC